jgi:hypothetical protein
MTRHKRRLAAPGGRPYNVRCAECGAEVPVLREFCLNCGTPTDPGLRERRRQLGQGRRTNGELKSNRNTFLIAAAALLGLGVVGNSWFGPNFDFDWPDRPAIGEQDAPRGPVTIEADQLYQAYRDNPQGSAERFGGREMVVSGEFLRIVPDGYGSLDLRLKTSNPEAQVGVDLAQLAIEDGKKLIPGQRVTVSCQQMGSGGDELWVQDCAIQPMAEPGAAPAASAPASAPTAPAPPAASAPPATEDGSE